ncbi:MAG: glycosyltransferase family 39 protein [Polyangiaceae bacterium]|nr:glycosyltransferase family 39 protein [Polyangiaceae bacterium]
MPWTDRLLVVLTAALARGAVVAWAAGQVPPAADGVFYHRLASRLAEGAGYTWLWPDGVVTYAAHYPVGYPFLLSLLYRVLGPIPGVAALLNAALGVAAAAAIHALTHRLAGRRAGLLAGLLVALDPALVLYTPALMTEGVVAALLALVAWLVAAASSDRRWWAAAALALGLCALVRPQCLLAAPLLGLLAPYTEFPYSRRQELRARLTRGALLTAGALAVCLPWAARNCARMDRCTLVSANGGWNLLIGAGPKATGHWSPVDVPEECREVFPEVAKDQCFGAAARRIIAREPARWLGLVPAKLAATFDYCGAGPWYLHDAAPAAFPYEAKVRWGAVETVFHRLLLVGALAGLGRGAQGKLGKGLAVAGALLALTRGGWMAYVALAALAGVRWGQDRHHFLAGALLSVLGSTLVVHGVFFGAGRYSLVVFPLIAACTGALLTGEPQPRDTAPHAPD